MSPLGTFGELSPPMASRASAFELNERAAKWSTLAMVKDASRTIALVFVLGFPVAAAAHGGGLDAAGCHNDNKHGGYQ
jgi:hypothetical protein